MLFPPNVDAFFKAYSSEAGQRALRSKVTLLHCTSEYPAPFQEVNLRVLQTMANTFGLKTGYSDHTLGINIPIASVAFGASIIEKHFTLDRGLEGPDHKASLEPNELKNMIDGIQEAKLAMGDGIKLPTISEIRNKDIVRKSIVVMKDIHKGEDFSYENLSVMRPGTGKSPYLLWEIIGTKATRDYKAGEVLSE